MRFVFAVVLASGIGTSVNAQPEWVSEYLPAEKASQISVCIAYVNYNNASFAARLYGDVLDFLFQRDDFTLPYGEFLGAAVFVVDGQRFPVLASTSSRTEKDLLLTAQWMLMEPQPADRASLFVALKAGSNFSIEFPNGDTYPITLRGSYAALEAASNCWSRNKTGALDNNPFEKGDGAGNPFGDGESSDEAPKASPPPPSEVQPPSGSDT